VKRFLAVLALVVGPVVGVAPAAHPLGEGACTITGTISFSPQSATQGTWKIGPAILDCQGIMAARWRITGRGPLKGSGTFTELPSGGGSCLHHAGTGTMDYTIPTGGGDLVISERNTYTLAGAGALTTPTLNGPLELLPPFDGDCVSKPVTRATFLAQVTLLRNPEVPDPRLLIP